jgi:hypothetical protein
VNTKENKVRALLIAATMGATVAFVWMYLASAAITYGVPFPAAWNLAIYISCPVISLLGPNFWPVVLGNALFYFACTWIVFAYIGKKGTAFRNYEEGQGE